MNCPKCNRENEDGAMYCRFCGSPMHQSENKESNFSTVLLFVWVIATCVLSLINQLITKLAGNWYESSVKIVVYGVFILQNLITLLPVFAIKNKTLKIIGIVVMSIMVIWWIIQNVQAMLL